MSAWISIAIALAVGVFALLALLIEGIERV